MAVPYHYTAVKAPFGNIFIVGNNDVIQYIGLQRPFFSVSYSNDIPLLSRTAEELRGYISGKLRTLHKPPIPSLSPFQQAVLKASDDIGYGEYMTYEALAKIIGKPHSARAVMHTCRSNPLWIIFPTHRLVVSEPFSANKERCLDAAEMLRRMERRYLRTP